MAALLVKHDGEQLKEMSNVPLSVRVWLADYFQNQGDARVLTWSESVLDELKAPQGEAQERLAFQAIERMGWFYRDQGQYEVAANTWARVFSYVTDTKSMIPDATWQIGRMYLSAGKPEMAETYFNQAALQKNKFILTMVTYDRVGVLLRAGKSVEASQLVRQTLQEITAPVDRAVALMSLTQSLYASGDFVGAQTAAQSCLEEAAQAKNVNSALGFGMVAPTARSLLKWSQIWQKTPMICSPEVLTHKAKAGGDSPWKTRVTVRSFKTIALNVKCDDARVKCTVVPLKDDPWFPRQETRFVEQIIEVEVPLETALQTELHISSSQFPGVSCDIPLQFSS